MAHDVADLLAADPYAALLGVELASSDPLVVGMLLDDRHTNFLGGAHGGVIYSLADIGLSLASNRDGLRSVMVDSHLAAVRGAVPGERLEAEVTPISEGRTIASYRIDVRRDDGRILAAFTGTTVRVPA